MTLKSVIPHHFLPMLIFFLSPLDILLHERLCIYESNPISLPIMAAAGIIFGVVLLLMSLTGLIDWLAKFFTKAIMRGIQLGLGFILINKGIGFIACPQLFIQQPDTTISLGAFP